MAFRFLGAALSLYVLAGLSFLSYGCYQFHPGVLVTCSLSCPTDSFKVFVNNETWPIYILLFFFWITVRNLNWEEVLKIRKEKETDETWEGNSGHDCRQK